MFVIVEGPNGAGKTSLIKNLELKGYQTLSSPNGTPLAKMLRSACRGTNPWEDIDKKVQFLLFSAARLDEYIRLVHNKKDVVIADRWWTSTYVYQCIFQGISVDFLDHTIHQEEKVDLVILLDGSEDILFDRLRKEREKNDAHGNCRWTQNRNDTNRIVQIYRENLPPYLKSKGVPCEIIQTDTLDAEGVLQKAIDLIEKAKNEKE